MSTKKLQGRFEYLIASLAVTQGKEQYLKNQVNYLKKKLKQYSKWQYDPPENEIEDISNQLSVKGFWYGGSFDRGVISIRSLILMIISFIRKLKV